MATPQFTLYVHVGPNPWKVVMVLEELKLSYRTIPIDTHTGEHKRPPYTNLNPNGRMPTLIDHSNNDFVIWESGAIILYLIEKYDTEHKLNPATFEAQATAKQYLMFQMSGQGPYFGQAAWFSLYHHEKLPSAVERYENEILRVIGVLNDVLKDKKYLVEDKLSYADLSFVTWLAPLDKPYFKLSESVRKWKEDEKFAAVKDWLERLTERDSFKKAMEIQAECGNGKESVRNVQA